MVTKVIYLDALKLITSLANGRRVRSDKGKRKKGGSTYAVFELRIYWF